MSNNKKLRPGQQFQMRSVDELLGIVNEEAAMDIEIGAIRPFKNHPFKVQDDEKMEELVESIRTKGVLSPVLLRSLGMGKYEMISGHRRMHAAQILGLERIPAIIRDMSDDEAIVTMVDSNIQREELLPSEKAFAYKMKLDALRRQGSRSDLNEATSAQTGRKLEAADIVGAEVGESRMQVRRYIRLTELIPELLELVDAKRLQFTVGVEASYLDPEIQKWLNEYVHNNGMIRMNQILALREEVKHGAMTEAKLISVLNSTQPGTSTNGKLTFTAKRLHEFFPPQYTVTQMRDVIEDLLAEWQMSQQ